ncbi:MAG: anthranilate synthase component I family protein [Phycisphaerales bacterium]|jgi:anthranilate/para-aminobenzoate synthase component I|nr:anthranilate synthase component I family protein [Phycisphaerales bacterium]
MSQTSTQLSVLPNDAVALSEFHRTPIEVANSWPKDEPIVALIASGGEERWSRWSIIAPATGKRLIVNAMQDLAAFQSELESIEHTSLLPGWIGYVGYEFGKCFEPSVFGDPQGDRSCPLADFVWCDRCLVYDGEEHTWWSVGGLQPPKEQVTTGSLQCGALQDTEGDERYRNAVSHAKQYICDGDVFQANITRRFSATVRGDLRAAALESLASPGGWFGAWLELQTSQTHSIVSLSPELFLQYDGESRQVISRPMKGTRPLSESAEDLMHSEKDAAELHMIVDLMRNDLGRVCEFGSIQVVEPRGIEQHPTVWQCTGEVHGKVRKDCSVFDLLAATFPAGSITGAPKVRAMQIIEELESSPRGPYCGSIGVIGGSLLLNVAIRTAVFTGTCDDTDFQGTLHYSTGCGIVADSDVHDECEESHTKTNILRLSALT